VAHSRTPSTLSRTSITLWGSGSPEEQSSASSSGPLFGAFLGVANRAGDGDVALAECLEIGFIAWT
jgi:hypothetical protein